MPAIARVAAIVAVALATAPGKGGGGDVPRPGSTTPAAVAAGATALSATLSTADVAALRAAVRPELLKGGFGEAHMDRHLAALLRDPGGWSPLRARLGPAGIDGLYARFDASGVPTGLLVSEAKYGASRLGMTADGIQMGGPWRAARLGRLADAYAAAAAARSGAMPVAGPGGSVGARRLQVPLGRGGKATVFARGSAGGPWEFVGPPGAIPEAGDRAALVAGYLRLAASGSAPYESAIYRVAVGGGALRVTIRDAAGLGAAGGEASLPVRRELAIPLRGGRLEQLRGMARTEVAGLLRRRYPGMAPADVDGYARRIVGSARGLEAVFAPSPRSLAGTLAREGLATAGIVSALDVALDATGQYLSSGRIDWAGAGLSGTIALLGSAGGSLAGRVVVVAAARGPIADGLVRRASTALGLRSAALAGRGLGGVAAGGVASAIFAYGGYFAGLHDLRSAHRMAVGGGVGTLAGAGFGLGLFSLASAAGTASTGTPIALLSGAAAKSATLAWLGGGSLASGGLGTAGGAVVLSGGTLLVAIGAGTAVYAAFRYWDEKEDALRIRLTLAELRSRDRFAGAGIGQRRFEVRGIGGR